LPAPTLYMRCDRITLVAGFATMENNKEFAVLVGRAFLHELEAGHKESAVAFGRAFLLSLGMKGPESKEHSPFANGRPYGEHLVLAHN
jgi:hypothetical protein